MGRKSVGWGCRTQTFFLRFAVVGSEADSFLSTRMLSISSNCGQPGLLEKTSNGKSSLANKSHGSGSVPPPVCGSTSPQTMMREDSAGPRNRSPTPKQPARQPAPCGPVDPVRLNFSTVLNPACCLLPPKIDYGITDFFKETGAQRQLHYKLVLFDRNAT